MTKRFQLMMAAGLCSAAVLLFILGGDNSDHDPQAGSSSTSGNSGSDRQPRRFRSDGNESGDGSGPAPRHHDPEHAERDGTGNQDRVPAELVDAFNVLEEATDEERAGRIMEIAQRWMAIDPKAALAWAFELESGSDRAVVGLLMGSWGRSDPQGAFAALQTAGASRPELREFAERLLFDHWAAADPSAAWEAAGQLADPRQRAMVASGILQSLSQIDPVLAAERLNGLISESGSLDDLSPAFESTGGNLAATDPVAAATWAIQVPDGAAREAAVSGVVGVWLYQDYDAAAAWLRSLPEGDARDAGVDRMVAATRNRNPGEAFGLAEGVSDPALRSRLLSMVSLGWLSSHPEEARAAIQGSNALSAEEKAAIFGSHRAPEE